MNKPVEIQTYARKPTYPRTHEIPTPLKGYTGQKKVELIKDNIPDRLNRPIDQFIPGYTGYQKPVEEPQLPVKHPEDKMRGYAGFQPRVQREEDMLKNMKTEPQFKVNGYQIPGYTGFIPQVKAQNVIGHSYTRITKQQLRGDENIKLANKTGGFMDAKDHFLTTQQAAAKYSYGLTNPSLVQVRAEEAALEAEKEAKKKAQEKSTTEISLVMKQRKCTFTEAKEYLNTQKEADKCVELNAQNAGNAKLEAIRKAANEATTPAEFAAKKLQKQKDEINAKLNKDSGNVYGIWSKGGRDTIQPLGMFKKSGEESIETMNFKKPKYASYMSEFERKIIEEQAVKLECPVTKSNYQHSYQPSKQSKMYDQIVMMKRDRNQQQIDNKKAPSAFKEDEKDSDIQNSNFQAPPTNEFTDLHTHYSFAGKIGKRPESQQGKNPGMFKPPDSDQMKIKNPMMDPEEPDDEAVVISQKKSSQKKDEEAKTPSQQQQSQKKQKE